MTIMKLRFLAMKNKELERLDDFMAKQFIFQRKKMSKDKAFHKNYAEETSAKAKNYLRKLISQNDKSLIVLTSERYDTFVTAILDYWFLVPLLVILLLLLVTFCKEENKNQVTLVEDIEDGIDEVDENQYNFEVEEDYNLEGFETYDVLSNCRRRG